MKLIQTLSSGKNGKMNWLTLGEKWQKQSLMRNLQKLHP